MERQRDYLRAKSIPSLFNDCALQLMEHEPDDPVAFLVQYLSRLAPSTHAQQQQQQQQQAEDGAPLQRSRSIAKWPAELESAALSVVVMGASGDLARKKTFPALFALYCKGLLPTHTRVVGYARTRLDPTAYHSAISSHFGKRYGPELRQDFLSLCTYVSGPYDDASGYAALNDHLTGLEERSNQQHGHSSHGHSNRLFYLALPPSVYVDVATGLQARCQSAGPGWTRLIVEKPFGHDSASSAELSARLGRLFREDQLYRIDHYLGKEMVQNLVALRFSNKVFAGLWSSAFVRTVLITFKEPFGTQGRGGYFDGFGIIRDVLQNHLLQVLAIVAMEKPRTLDPEAIRDEKVHVLRAIAPLAIEDVVLGQYVRNPNGEGEAYLDDPTVPKGSRQATFCTAKLFINNDRWAGVPFILKAGKALNERKAEIRIQFKPEVEPYGPQQAARDELVVRIQPEEAIYLKYNAKQPGLTSAIHQTELNLTYETRYTGVADQLPDAYESLVYECLQGNRANFVRTDELDAAWSIFTPLLHKLEADRPLPVPYIYGSRGPKESDDLIEKCGYLRNPDYVWKPLR